MDFKKINLKNERSTHVTKRLNRLNTWKFFGVLYRENTWRVFGFSLLMLLLLVPMFFMLIWGSVQVTSLQQSLPTNGAFGAFGTGVWEGVGDYFQQQKFQLNIKSGLLAVAVSTLACLTLCGGFAVIRDSFWVGKLKTDKTSIFKSLWKGITAGIGYAFVAEVIIAFSLFGIFTLSAWLPTVMATWLAVIIIVIISIVALLLTVFLLIMCSVAVTYKQSVGTTLRDAWLLMWLNILPNILNFLFSILPIALYLITMGGMLQSFVAVLIFMFGGMYFPLVWQSHMMRTFALFNPVVAPKKNKKVKVDNEITTEVETPAQ